MILNLADIYPNLDGTISPYWENDLPGANYSGNNRSFKMDLSSNTNTNNFKTMITTIII